MHRKRRLAGLLTALLLAAAVSGCTPQADQGTSTDDKVMAEFSQGSVTEKELYERLVETAGMNTMLEIVDRGILDDVLPVDEEIERLAQENIAEIEAYYGDEFENVLQANGFKDIEKYRDVLYLNLQRNAYILRHIQENVLMPEEIQAYYDGFEPEIEASHILISPEGDGDAQWQAALDEAKALISRYEAGEAFADLAVEYSDDTGSGAVGGELGAFSKGMMVPEFEEAAFGLAVGDHTPEPVKTQFGYHIILKTAGEDKKSLEDMKPEIEKTLAEMKLQQDESLGYKALIKMREDNGFTINNHVLKPQYESFVEGFKAE